MASNNIIKKLKSHFGVFTDTALADKLNVSQPTIASWKNRKIPNHILMQYATILGDLVQADSDMVANREPKIISGAGEKVVVAEQPIHIQKGNKQVDIQHSKDSTSLDAAYIIDLQKDKIQNQEKEIALLKKQLKQKKDATCNHTFESMDYDIITYQTYNTEHEKPYKYFSSYEIVRWKDFCKKLGYVGQEAVELHNFIQAEGRNNLQKYKGKEFNWLLRDKSQKHMCNYDYTHEFFNNAKLSNFVNAVESYNIQYIHKDGTYIPAIVTVLYDMKGISSVSKIKFLDTGN